MHDRWTSQQTDTPSFRIAFSVQTQGEDTQYYVTLMKNNAHLINALKQSESIC